MFTAWKLIKEGFVAFYKDNALSRGAAIAFYLVTALGPILFITVVIAGLGFGQDAVQGAVGYQLQTFMSMENARILQNAIRSAYGLSTGWNSLLVAATVIITASGVFGEVEDALNDIWKAPHKGSVLLRLLHGRLRSLALVFALGLLFLISMILSAGITFLSRFLDRETALSLLVIHGLNFTISLALISTLVAAIYKILPNKKLEWRDVIVGAVGTTLLFQLGQTILGFYLGRMHFEVPYGTAGGLIALLVWAYYSAQVLLLGAEFTKVWARHYGSQQDWIPAPSVSSPSQPA